MVRIYGTQHKIKPDGAKYWYCGTLHHSHMEDVEAKRAYASWRDQRHRCRNSNVHCYKYYGAKGIQVKYSSREFVGWWIEQQELLKLKRPTISRIDHDGHYEFGNIKLEEHMQNCVTDVLKRYGPPGLKCTVSVVIYDYKSMEPLMIISSGKKASELTEVAAQNIIWMCKKRGKSKQGKGYTFRYAS